MLMNTDFPPRLPINVGDTQTPSYEPPIDYGGGGASPPFVPPTTTTPPPPTKPPTTTTPPTTQPPPGTTPPTTQPGAPVAGTGGTAAGTGTSYIPPTGPLAGGGSSYNGVNGVDQYYQANTSAATRAPTEQEMVEYRLNNLLSGDSRYIRDARLRAREQASASGMLMSSVSAGNAERAAIQAGLPIASQDAQAYGAAAAANQAALNEQRMADQANLTGFIGQDVGIQANASESSQQRQFQAGQSERAIQSNAAEAAQTRVFSADQATRDKEFNAQQAEEARTWQGTQADLQRKQQRDMAYYEIMFGREGQLSQTLASIYANPNLDAAQQKAAADNATAVYSQLWSTQNATLAQGIPEIYSDPYPIAP